MQNPSQELWQKKDKIELVKIFHGKNMVDRGWDETSQKFKIS